jgi:UDP-N-acetylmuramate--alanine ligase
MIHAIARPGDYVVCLGAGNITNWAHALPAQLTELQSRARGRLAGAMK